LPDNKPKKKTSPCHQSEASTEEECNENENKEFEDDCLIFKPTILTTRIIKISI